MNASLAGLCPSNLSPGGSVIYLGVTGASDLNTGLLMTAPKATLTGALAACVSGRSDVIVVLPGTYDVHGVQANKANVKILGWSYLIGLSNNDDIVLDAPATPMDIVASYIELAGLTFKNGVNDTNCMRFGTVAGLKNLSIHDCRFLQKDTGGVGASAIIIDASSSVEHVEIFNNYIFCNDGLAIKLLTSGTNYVTIKNNTIVSDSWGIGIQLPNANIYNVVICKNNISVEGGTGIERLGASATAVAIQENIINALTPITVLADGGNDCVENYRPTAAGGALIDATT
jgi:hypothetical protein